MKAFLDASVLIAGIYSLSGGSALVLNLVARKEIRGYASTVVLLETENNIREKLPREFLARYYKTITEVPLVVLPAPNPSMVRNFYTIIHPKDAHVLASFNESQADYLVTLDKKHFFTKTVLQRFPNKIVTPKELLAIFTT